MSLSKLVFEKICEIYPDGSLKEKYVCLEHITHQTISTRKYFPKVGDVLFLDGCTIPSKGMADWCRLHEITVTKKPKEANIHVIGPKIIDSLVTYGTHQYIQRAKMISHYPEFEFSADKSVQAFMVNGRNTRKVDKPILNLGSYKYVGVFESIEDVRKMELLTDAFSQDDIIGNFTDIGIDHNKWKQLDKMLSSKDADNQNFALTIMISTNYKQSAPYLLDLIYQYVRFMKVDLKNTGLKNMLDYFHITHLAIGINDIFTVLKLCGLSSQENRDIISMLKAERGIDYTEPIKKQCKINNENPDIVNEETEELDL